LELLTSVLERLPVRHRSALQWFLENAGKDVSWPNPLPDGTLLASRAKGIYKPAWSEYALSVRQNVDGPYPDREPATRTDGTWSYLYFQEGEDPTVRDSVFTNRGLMECYKDRVPIGVIRQTARQPRTVYQVLGLALVVGWEDGYFLLEGFSRDGQSKGPVSNTEIEVLSAFQEKAAANAKAFDPGNIMDGRERIVASIVIRRGQPEFRRILIRAYKGRCAVSGCDAIEVLEAAHIMPYLGQDTNHPSNGILLRADIHTLFDLGLLSIDTDTM
jgi:putative restriction endonuclease